MQTRAPLRPGTLSPWREVPATIPRPEYVGKAGPKKYRGSDIQTPETIEKMILIKQALGACAPFGLFFAPDVVPTVRAAFEAAFGTRAW